MFCVFVFFFSHCRGQKRLPSHLDVLRRFFDGVNDDVALSETYLEHVEAVSGLGDGDRRGMRWEWEYNLGPSVLFVKIEEIEWDVVIHAKGNSLIFPSFTFSENE